MVSSEDRAETLAEHLENVQWKVRPATLVPGTAQLQDVLPQTATPFTYPELRKTTQKMKAGKVVKE